MHDNRNHNRAQLIEKLGGETNYKKMTAYILSGNSGRDLCDLYLEMVAKDEQSIRELTEEIQQSEAEIFKDCDSDSYEEIYNDFELGVADNLIWE